MSLASGVGCPACHDTIPSAQAINQLASQNGHLGFSVHSGAKDSGDHKQAIPLSFTVLQYEIRWLEEFIPKNPLI